MIALEGVNIRTVLQPGDMGYVIYLHGHLYGSEYGYSINFESYVAAGFHEFYARHDPKQDRVWVCEHKEQIVGFLLLMNRGSAAQLRYFIIMPEYRGIGLGKKLMKLYMEELSKLGYKSSYLLTVDELPAAASLYRRHGFRLVQERSFEDFGKLLMEQRYEVVLTNS
jgi:ribosomal protein S18 acetylase RimI-like enzyme